MAKLTFLNKILLMIKFILFYELKILRGEILTNEYSGNLSCNRAVYIE